MSDREELAALIDSIVTNDPPTPLKAADAILARWRLVPVSGTSTYAEWWAEIGRIASDSDYAHEVFLREIREP